MKVKGLETVAGKGMMVSSIRSFYCSYYEPEEVQVLKDTWAI
jgi:hypothetical protein